MWVVEKSDYYKTVNFWIDELKTYKPNTNEVDSLTRARKHYRTVSERVLSELKHMLKWIKTEKNEYKTWCRTTVWDELIDRTLCKECEKNWISECISLKQKEILDELLYKHYKDE